MSKFTSEMDTWLKQNHAQYSQLELTHRFNAMFDTSYSVNSIRHHCKDLQLKTHTKHTWTPEELNWIKLHVAHHTWKELVELFNARFNTDVTVCKMKNIGRKHRIQHETTRVNFTEEQTQWLIDHVPGAASWTEVTENFNRVFGTHKTQTALRSKVRFMDGVYINGGKTGNQGGTPSHNSLPIGAERKLSSGYTYVKTTEGTWEPKQKVIYEQVYGPIPDDSFVIFLNKDPTDFELDNLYVVNRSLHAGMCNYSWYSTDPVQTLAGLKYWELVKLLKEL